MHAMVHHTADAPHSHRLRNPGQQISSKGVLNDPLIA